MHGYRAISAALAGWKGSFGEFVQQLDKDRVPYLSFSKIASVESCQQKYLLEYVEGVEYDQPLYFTKGTVFHEAAGLVYQQLAQGGVDLKPVEKLANRHFHEESAGHIINAVQLLIDNAHRDHEVIATELPFVLSLGPGMPPMIGVIDLVLRKGDTFLVVDHKTGKKLYDQDAFQLHLYREHVRRAFKPRVCRACFDEYRWVNNLHRIRKPAFRRTPVQSKRWPSVLGRVQKGWKAMRKIEKTREASGGGECVFCLFKDDCPKAEIGWSSSWW